MPGSERGSVIRSAARSTIVRDVGARLVAAGALPTPEAVHDALRAVCAERKIRLREGDEQRLAQVVADELAGYGPVGPLLRDPSVTEVMINGARQVFAERDGRLEQVRVAFRSDAEVLHLIDRIVSPLGLRVDASSPWVDARLPDGSRVHAIVPPIAVGGPTVTIRKFSRDSWELSDLVSMGSLDAAQARLLADAVRNRRNLLVCGGAGSGKTTLLGVLGRLIPAHERVITIEDAAELRLGARHVVSLETRPANVEGRGEVTLRDLVRCALRMRPDRIVVGEVRSVEALDMLHALNSGHAGSMATVHSNSPSDALVRLEALALLASPGLSVQAARRQVASAIEIVVHVERTPAGRRRVAGVCEVRVSRGEPLVVRLDRAAQPTTAHPQAESGGDSTTGGTAARSEDGAVPVGRLRVSDRSGLAPAVRAAVPRSRRGAG